MLFILETPVHSSFWSKLEQT